MKSEVRSQKSGVGSRRLKAATGFTLIELMTVIVIIMILVGLVIRGGRYALQKAQQNRAKAEVATIEMALENFKADESYYPRSDGGLNSSTNLVKTLMGGSKVYLNFHANQILVSGGVTNLADPFGGRYFYLCPGTNNPTAYDLWSNGADGMMNTPDDVSNWK